jgi:hypothetical protein
MTYYRVDVCRLRISTLCQTTRHDCADVTSRVSPKCLYCQLVDTIGDDSDVPTVSFNVSNPHNKFVNEERSLQEYRFVPAVTTDNADPVATIYEAMCKGAELNPGLYVTLDLHF